MQGGFWMHSFRLVVLSALWDWPSHKALRHRVSPWRSWSI